MTGDPACRPPPAGVELADLADYPEAIGRLARWYHDEWYDIERLSLAALTNELTERLSDATLGRTFLARADGAVVGCISLDRSDLPGHESLGPWLASLYVVPAWRGRGLGATLIRHVVRVATAAGAPALYLWTAGSTRRYEAAGFHPLQQTLYGTRPITVMRRLAAAD